MIEVIYKDESQEGQNGEEPFGLPRNIRQIGLAAEDYRIYMEDYVYTFLVRLARAEDSLGEAKTRVAVLTGNLKWRSQTAYLFIKGAIIAEEMEQHLIISIFRKINGSRYRKPRRSTSKIRRLWDGSFHSLSFS